MAIPIPKYRHVGLKDYYWRKKVKRLVTEGKLELVDTIESDQMDNIESTIPHPDSFKHALNTVRIRADANLHSKIKALKNQPDIVLIKKYEEGSMSYQFWATAVAELYRNVDKQDNIE